MCLQSQAAECNTTQTLMEIHCSHLSSMPIKMQELCTIEPMTEVLLGRRLKISLSPGKKNFKSC